MLFQVSSQLMPNQKYAEIMSPTEAFQVLQTPSGGAMFFSIDTSGVLYVTREITGSKTGWSSKLDLSSRLSEKHKNAKIKAKHFALTQNLQTMHFDIVVVVTVGSWDYLYYSFGHTNNPLSWEQEFDWKYAAFDAPGLPSGMSINIDAVYLMNIPSSGSKTIENLFVDVVRNPGQPEKLIQRYYVNPAKATKWKEQVLAIDLDAGTITSCLGLTETDPIPGIYTYGTIEKRPQLIFVPQYDEFDPVSAPPVTRLQLPNVPASSSSAMAIASAPGLAGLTNLFVASSTGLYVFTPDNQRNKATPRQIIPTSNTVNKNLFAGVTEMSAYTLRARTIVWCLNANKQLFYVWCPAGSEGVATKWSNPVPMYSPVENFAFFINDSGLNNVVFAHITGSELRKYTQDPASGMWHHRNILLPPPKVSAITHMDTFTTRIQVYDDAGGLASKQQVVLQAMQQTSAYINNIYYAMDPAIPVKVETSTAGDIIIVQQTDSFLCSCFQIMSTDGNISVNFDPMATGWDRLSTIKSGSDLSAINVPTETGGTHKLIPTTVSSENLEAGAQALQQLMIMKSKLPQNGTKQENPIQDPGTLPSFGINYAGATHRFMTEPNHSGRTTSSQLESNDPEGPLDAIKIGVGDLLHLMHEGADDVLSFTINTAKGFWHLLTDFGHVLYEAALDCLSAVALGAQFIINKLKAGWNWLKNYLGDLLIWPKIVRTHDVMGKIIRLELDYMKNKIDTIPAEVGNIIQTFNQKISTWTGITGPNTTVGQRNSEAGNTPGSDNPLSHWGISHIISGLEDIVLGGGSMPSGGLPSTVVTILEELEKIVNDEIAIVKQALDRLKTEVIDDYTSLSPFQVIERIVGIVALLVGETAGNVLVKFLEIVVIMIDDAFKLLDKDIEIPVISYFYKKFVGRPMSFLDLIILGGAIPATICYKVASSGDDQPFNDDDFKAVMDPKVDTFEKLIQVRMNSGTLADQTATFWDTKLGKIISVVTNMLACGGAYVTGAASLLLAVSPTLPNFVKKLVTTVNFAAYAVYLSPDFLSIARGTPYDAWNLDMVMIDGFKAAIDCLISLSDKGKSDEWWTKIGSPVVEAIINAIWLGPPIWQFIEDKSKGQATDILNFAGNIVFDLGGICTIAASDKIDPPYYLIGAGVCSAATVIAGRLFFASAAAAIPDI